MKIVFRDTRKIPVTHYGGGERILYWLMKALVKLGHEVVFIGPKGSQVQQIGVKHRPWDLKSDWRLLVPKDSNIITSFELFTEEAPLPVLFRIGGNGKPGNIFPQNTIFVSRKHASLHNSDAFVYNGIDLDEYPFLREPRNRFDEFLFLAKASWRVKNRGSSKVFVGSFRNR